MIDKELINLNIFNSKSLKDVYFYIPQSLKYYIDNNIREFKYFGEGEEDNLDKWKFEDFTYKIDDYGFRIENTESTFGVFGCSYTFGQGLPVYMTWHNILSKRINENILNFGIPGASISTIADIFCIVTKHVKLSKVVILLPSFERLQIAKYNKNNKIEIVDLTPGSNTKFKKFFYNIDTENLYKFLPKEEFVKKIKNSLFLIDFISAQRNIKTYITSWSADTYNVIKNINFDSIDILPVQWINPTTDNLDLARDNRHPGPNNHAFFAESISHYII